MKKILNNPADALIEALQGFTKAHDSVVRLHDGGRFVTRVERKNKDKVAIVSGGGSGHEPMHLGFIGTGMLDAACPGEVFTSPTPAPIAGAIEAVTGDAGCLMIVKNYAGDIMNFEMASEMCDHQVEIVVTDDDVALLDVTRSDDQPNRGVAGTLIVEKIVGAAAENGLSLNECAELGRRVNNATGSMAAALSSCTVPVAGTPTFELVGNEIELGVGIHGEAGRERIELCSADELAELFIAAILEKLDVHTGDEVLLMCNGLGATPPIELYVLFNSAVLNLEQRGISVARSQVGTFCTALDMAGASLTVTKLDQQVLALWDEPVKTVTWQWG